MKQKLKFGEKKIHVLPVDQLEPGDYVFIDGRLQIGGLLIAVNKYADSGKLELAFERPAFPAIDSRPRFRYFYKEEFSGGWPLALVIKGVFEIK